MPGGKNSYTRPANKPQRAARKRQNARNEAVANLVNRRSEMLEDQDQLLGDKIENYNALGRMILDIDDASMEDRATLRQGTERAKQRKANRYKMKSGGRVGKMKSGGKVRRDGCAVRGKTKGRIT